MLYCQHDLSKDQDIIKIYNNMKTLTLAKEQYAFNSEVKTLMAVARPKGKTFHQ